MHAPLLALGLALATSSPAPAAGASGHTWIVDASGAGDHVTIQAAVDAAAAGDTILVLDHFGQVLGSPSDYPAFVVDGKSLTLVADPGYSWSIAGAEVRGLAAGEAVVLHGLPLAGPVTVRDCAGAVRLDGLRSRRAPVLEVLRSDDVTLGGCDLVGGRSGFGVEEPLLRVVDSDVAISASTLAGVEGHTAGGFVCDAGQGAHALVVEGASRVRIEDSTLRGGDAGLGFACPGTYTGAGGSAVVQSGPGAQVWVREARLAGGTSIAWISPAGTAPAVLGAVTVSPRVARAVRAATVGRAGAALEVEVTGAPGDAGSVLVSSAPGALDYGLEEGRLLLGGPFRGGRRGVPVDLPTGRATIQVPLDPVDPAETRTLFVQAVLTDGAGGFTFSPVRTVVRLGGAVPVALGGEVVHVDASRPPGGDGRSWATAIAALQGGLARAWGSAELPASVWVGAGVQRAPRDARFIGFGHRSGVDVLGGFLGTESSPSERPPAGPPTVVSGDVLGDDALPGGGRADNAGILWTVPPPHRPAAGPRMDRVERLQFIAADSFDGAVCFIDRPVHLEACRFTDNRARVLLHDALDAHATRLRDCSFVGNASGVAQLGDARLEQCLVLGNRALSVNLLYLEWPSEVRDCTIALNTVDGINAGLTTLALEPPLNGSPAPGALVNTIVWGNWRPGQPGLAAAQVSGLDPGVWRHCCVEGHAPSFGAGNLSLDPRFVDPLGPDGAPGTGDEDLRLAPGSPCVDAGDNAGIPAGLFFDLAGARRRIDDPAAPDVGAGVAPLVDMGAFERVP